MSGTIEEEEEEETVLLKIITSSGPRNLILKFFTDRLNLSTSSAFLGNLFKKY